jgi:hypothetical protein
MENDHECRVGKDSDGGGSDIFQCIYLRSTKENEEIN